MEKYVMLLRGINVGGKNRVPMADLKAAMEKAGYQNVISYLNTGNLIFEHSQVVIEELEQELEELVLTNFDCDIRVLVITKEEYLEMVAVQPEWWSQDSESKHNAIFILRPMRLAAVLAEVGPIKDEYEQLAYSHNLFFWSAPIKTFSRASWAKVHGKKSYSSMTIRNANTFRKLAELLADESSKKRNGVSHSSFFT